MTKSQFNHIQRHWSIIFVHAWVDAQYIPCCNRPLGKHLQVPGRLLLLDAKILFLPVRRLLYYLRGKSQLRCLAQCASVQNCASVIGQGRSICSRVNLRRQLSFYVSGSV